ncbi:transporter, CPA2 family [Desulfuromonas soudanensis]|uniref:Transporter, CPA2 family n=1 Tax=Desulfuromonas soudanensis TaxID=1603606 RepID=A0A0M3QGI9_9BACT|nr:cation:proton antiporter [Desulfuromonas soudanensis]ALC17893.1 transporter, CPA2 family [Desulfuromonas soudanensis]
MINKEHLVIFLVLLGAAVIPFLARRVRLPSAALEIVYGTLLFNFVVHHRPDWFTVLREIGFIYLMFIAGMELELGLVRKSGKAGWYLLISVLSFSVTPFLFFIAGQPYFLGVAVAMISAGIVIPVLKESELIKTPLGRDIVGVALTGELLSILTLTLIDAHQKHGFTLEAALELAKLALLFGLALLVLKLLYLAAWWHPERVEKVMESEDPVEEGIRAVVTVAFAGGLLAAAAGAEPILGSFLAGMIFSHVFKSRGRFDEKVNALGFGFLIPFFFIGVGAQLDLRFLASPETVGIAALLTLMVLGSNLYPLLLHRPLRLTLLEATGMSLLLSAPLSMIVVAGTLGEKMGILSPEHSGALILTALFASILYPSLFRPISRRIKSKLAAAAG